MDGFKRIGLDGASVALSSFGLVFLLYGFSTFSSSERPLVALILIVAGAGTLAMFVRRQLALEAPMLMVRVFKSRQYAAGVACVGITQAAIVSMNVLIPMFVQSSLGYFATVSGLVSMPGALLSAFLSLLAGRAFDRMGIRKLALSGALCSLVGAVLFCTLGTGASVVAVSVLFAMVLGGAQFVIGPCNAWVLNSLDNDVIQHANALNQTIGQACASLGTAAVISLTAFAGLFCASGASDAELVFVGHHVAFFGIAALVLVLTLLAVFTLKDKPSQTPNAAMRAFGDEAGPTATS